MAEVICDRGCIYRLSILLHYQSISMSGRKQIPPGEGKPISVIMSIKSNDDLRTYLQERPDLNLSIMREKNESTLVHFSAFKNELSKLRIYVQHFEAFHRRSKMGGGFEGQLRAWLNHPNTDGVTPLHFAALHGNTDMLHFLQHHGANMLAQSKDKETALFMAVENNQLKTVVYLLEHREGRTPYNPNDVNHLGDTILHKAAKQGFTNLTAYLLVVDGMDVDSRNLQGWTPLMYAAYKGHKQLVKRMLLKGVSRQLINLEDKRAIDLAREQGHVDLVRVLDEELSRCDKIKVGCNFKVVYRVEKPSVKNCILFLFLFHLVLIPTHLLVQVNLFGDDTYLVFDGLIAAYYLTVIVLFGLLTRKHPKKPRKDLMDIELPCCPECRTSLRSTQFHCFICGVCVSRYDHHCPWINNCVSAFNIGKFTAFLVLLMFGCVEVLFISITQYCRALEALQPSQLLPITDSDRSKYELANMIVCGLLAALFISMLISLLGDQLKNLFSNTTSYERAKSLRKSTLLEQEENVESGINNDLGSIVEEEQQEKSCLGNCWNMLKEKYEQGDD